MEICAGGGCVRLCVLVGGWGGVGEMGVSRPVICERESMAYLRTRNLIDGDGINWAEVSVGEVGQGQIMQSCIEHVQGHKLWEPLASSWLPPSKSATCVSDHTYILWPLSNQYSTVS